MTGLNEEGPHKAALLPATGATGSVLLGHAQHLRRDEHQQCGLVLAAATLLEQVAQERHVAQERNLAHAAAVAPRY
ncbi:hypothetical protein G6F40_017660 [Rhizopus arrhizus]|nr:hypothetical protein G6F40_017660 [Rhizopus arrhizus]